ncbi:aspartate/glutamate racemase family protein [Vibrio sp.]|uniref:aspartate/glutamate racemase family protein n=1 Tax=Vibrio sp. TaxID=678 RepID=UPI003D109D5E
MKTIGLIGGMSWESTTSYYQLINQGIKQRLGGLNSAKIVLNSINFAELEPMQRENRWDDAADLLVTAAKSVEQAGADFVMICTNTMHKVADEVADAVTIPLLHIADATGAQLTKEHIRRVGLLGTAFTMEQSFYKQRLQQRFDLEVLVPEANARERVHQVIYQELCLGQIRPESKAEFIDVINQLKSQGAQAIILGCTEIGLLVEQQDVDIPLYDTTAIHAKAAIELALQGAMTENDSDE